MNNQDVPPKPGSPPPAPAPESVSWSQPQTETEGARRKPVTKKRAFWIALFVVVLLAVIGGLVWLALWLNSGQGAPEAGEETPGVLETTITPPASPLPLPREGVTPAEYALGDCFADFDPEALASKVVPCDAPHSAQLVAVFRYPEDGAYPGAEELKAKALEACQAAKLGPAANEYQLNYQRSFPSDSSWDSGDRRVDCYVTAPGGNVINASVLP
ncbi:septum formation family protein [Pseudarthrobacter sp. NS4]|uniref:septum formation family protein n=1 Tax=Pseudarthrobacter sp. NS4 TaxID=2973976 RepID=UPI002162B9FB|nr:septum formation family protein [Pseudarthrobacter sp. NS4]